MPRAAALFARQLLLAAAERNGRSPREAAGTAIRAPRAELAETGRRRWAVLAVVSAAQFLVTLDLWVVNIALPALQHDFAPATLSEVSWILDVYAIVLAALLLPPWRQARRSCRGVPTRVTVSGPPGASTGWERSWCWARWAWCAPH